MPSSNDPKSSVNSGPGKLSIGTVPSSALLFSSGGGSGAALQAHINNPLDAHFAHAIGIDPFYPYPGGTNPILTSVGGVVSGESLLDFINEFKDLIPVRPNSLGFNVAAGLNSGIPNWGNLNSSLTGGYANGSNVTFSHFLLPNGTTNFVITGIIFPADRGVLAIYKTTSGNYFDSANTTLVAALSLNDSAPAGIPDSAFNEANRLVQQSNYTGAGSGLDLFSLTFRLPYLNNYTPYPGAPYTPYTLNFFNYQLASYSVTAQSIGAGNAQSFLLVHWKETYATSLSSIQPANLTVGNLTASNCYSAIPTASNFDDNTNAIYNVNRHNVFRDANSAAAPVETVFTSSKNGSPTTVNLSGVGFYSNGATPLHWTVDLRATGMASNSFQTGSSDNPPNVPAQFHSAFDPVQVDFSEFGGGLLLVPYYSLNKFGGGAYTATNSPAIGDTVEYTNSALAIVSPVSASPAGGFGQLKVNLRTPFQETIATDTTTKYLFNSYAQTGGGTLATSTYEPFVDEQYRYAIAFDPTTSAGVPTIPTGGNVFASGSALTSGGSDTQELGNLLVYPQVNFSTGYTPAGPDYSGFPGTDGANHPRRYQRAFDTGTARNVGTLRIRGLAYTAFQTNAAYNGTETTGHTTGGAIIQIKVPGASGSDWLDLGRAFGDPGVVGALGTSPFYGCSTGVTGTGGPGLDVTITYNTSAFTSNNGSGNFLLFVRVTLLNGAGTSLSVDEIQWSP